MSIDLSKEENFELLGKRLITLFCEWDYKASMVYVDGISFFDMELGVNKFTETDCRVCVEIYEFGMILFLMAKHGSLLRGFGIWNKDMLSMEMIKDVPIIVPKFSRWERVLPWAPVGGGIGYAIASYRKDKAARNCHFKIIGTREVM